MSLFHSLVRPDGTLNKIDLVDIPFLPAEVFFVSEVPIGSVRGKHAHRECIQLLVLLKGEILVRSANSGGIWRSQLLENPGDSFLLKPGTWGEQDFLKEDSILIVFCSKKFDENDYIRNIDDFFTK